ncbi:hypothetical protein U9M48_000298 [Paspalum notatum var. saurae]|uniref:Transposase MuDR plant domain-containing protein n=1 Tax=Paspalum notatum var. saurae TaxID=547442 RepID=A0AAQ3PM35_PASNO
MRAWKAATGRTWEGDTGTSSKQTESIAEHCNRMDHNTSYILQIKMLGNPKHARKDIRCVLIEKVVDADVTNIKNLVESITKQCPPGYLEVSHVQYYDEATKIFSEVKSDQDLMLMFEKRRKTKVVTMFMGYCNAFEPYELITEWTFDEQLQQNINDEPDDDNYLRNPFSDNEHVGKDKDYVPEDDSEDESADGDDDDDEDELEEYEELVGREATHTPNVDYDKEDPPMTEGSTYPNMKEFKVALCMHAIQCEFEFKTARSGPHRFIAYCSRKQTDKCPWRIYASSTVDRSSVVHKKEKKVKNATKHWVYEKVKDFLIDDATLKAKALQKKIKERYKTVAYDEVEPKEKSGKEIGRPQLVGLKLRDSKGILRKLRNASTSVPFVKTMAIIYWHNCKKGNPDDIAAMMAVRGPPKKKKKTTTSAQSSIMHMENESIAASMSFPPRRKSRSGSNQPKPLSIKFQSSNEQRPAPKKVKRKTKKKEIAKPDIPMPSFDSPAMETRSRTIDSISPAMSTASKRRLSL